MKKLIFGMMIGLALFSMVWAESVKLTTTVSGSTDKVGDADRPGLLFKFDLPAVLQNVRVNMANLRFQVQTDTSREPLGILVRPMLAPWTSGIRLAAMSESAASPFHVNFGRVGFNSGTAEVRLTYIVRAWQQGELPNFGILVYPAKTSASTFQLRNLTDGSVAELEIQYTESEKK
ncbi:MAG TPA: hypothetical protein VNL73_02795 [Verrucomicrobiae bacterium]|nr:hypothetical protein [Verrucomicrobiae bacterium]